MLNRCCVHSIQNRSKSVNIRIMFIIYGDASRRAFTRRPTVVGWCIRLPEVLSPLVCLLVSLCWMACPPSPVSCLPLSPIVYPFLFPFVGSSVGLKTRTFSEELLIGTARFCASFTTYVRVSWGWGGVGWGRVGWGGANNVPWPLHTYMMLR